MSDQPNILFIMTDQQRGDCLGVENHPCLMTPSMDSIATNGVRFRRAYSTCPVCIPARRSLMSGLHPANHGMVGYVDGQEWNPPTTLPQLLRDHGYHTGIVGRNMHLWPPRKRYGYEETAISVRLDGEYQEFMKQNAPHGGGYYGSGVMNNDWTARSWHLDEYLHQTNWTAEQALRFLRRRDPSRPWFLTVSFLAPHPPLVPPQFYFDRYLRTGVPAPLRGEWNEKPDFGHGAPAVNSNRVDLQDEALLSARAAYYGLINHVDDQIRRLLSREMRVYDPKNTMVIFTSDHGEMLGDHYFFRKSLPYEGAARIPFLIRLPDSIKSTFRGEISDLPVCLEDIMPTLLDVAGVEIPDYIDGKSLLPVLLGEKPADWREFLHEEHSGGTYGHHMLTDGQEKYIWFSQSGREQLFDLRNDPHELHDLAGQDSHQTQQKTWRERLVKTLQDRPEGFVENEDLVAGKPHRALLEPMKKFG